MNTEKRKRLRELEPPDCGDNSCAFARKRGGMRTNWGCGCLEDIRDRKARLYFLTLHTAVPELLDDVDRLEAENAALRARVAVLEEVRKAAAESLSWIRSTSRWRKRCQEFDAVMDNPIRDFNDEEEWDRLEAQASAQDNALRAALDRAGEP